MLLHLPGTAGAIAVALGRARLYGSTFLPITNSLLLFSSQYPDLRRGALGLAGFRPEGFFTPALRPDVFVLHFRGIAIVLTAYC
jgi:hypothetical protein